MNGIGTGTDAAEAGESWRQGWAEAAAGRVLARLDPLPMQASPRAAAWRRLRFLMPGAGGLPRLAAATLAAVALGGLVAMLAPSPEGPRPDADISGLILDAGPGVGLAQ